MKRNPSAPEPVTHHTPHHGLAPKDVINTNLALSISLDNWLKEASTERSLESNRGTGQTSNVLVYQIWQCQVKLRVPERSITPRSPRPRSASSHLRTGRGRRSAQPRAGEHHVWEKTTVKLPRKPTQPTGPGHFHGFPVQAGKLCLSELSTFVCSPALICISRET